MMTRSETKKEELPEPAAAEEPDVFLPGDGEAEPPEAGAARRGLSASLPYLAVAGGLGALEYLRGRFQRNHTFLPARYPSGTWNPVVFGLDAEDAWFRTDDGVGLHGWWIPHPRAAGTILFCHGNTGSIAHRIGVISYLHRLRMNVFAFDYRGYGRSAGQPTEKGLYKDVRAAYRHLVEELGEPAERVILFGQSLGGAVAVDAALDCPAAGLVVQSSFTDSRSMARVYYPRIPLHWVTSNQFRSAEKVDRLDLPKLFVHGTSDRKIPYQLGRDLYVQAAEPKAFLAVPGADHSDVHVRGGLPYMRRLVRFLRTSVRRAAKG